MVPIQLKTINKGQKEDNERNKGKQTDRNRGTEGRISCVDKKKNKEKNYAESLKFLWRSANINILKNIFYLFLEVCKY